MRSGVPTLTASFGGWGTSLTSLTRVTSIIQKYNYHKQSSVSLHPSFMKSHLVYWHLRMFLPSFFISTMYACVNVCVCYVEGSLCFQFWVWSLIFVSIVCSPQLWNKQSSKMKWDAVKSGSLIFTIIYAFHILTINMMIYRWEKIFLFSFSHLVWELELEMWNQNWLFFFTLYIYCAQFIKKAPKDDFELEQMWLTFQLLPLFARISH